MSQECILKALKVIYHFITNDLILITYGSSDCKESACNVGDPGSIPGSG